MAYEPAFIDLGPTPYARAYAEQLRHVDVVLASRQRGAPEAGRVLLVEHVPPVITVSRRQGASRNLLASPEALARAGIELHETDRGGDITYHGPGQLVVYPILDLNLLGLGLHAYMRMLEEVVIRTLARFGVEGRRDQDATGVWVEDAKVCAMGVRVKRWVSMHGLALNVTTNLDHFGLIVPCGLVGRPVTSLQRRLGERCPPMSRVRSALVEEFARATGACVHGAAVSAAGRVMRDAHGPPSPQS